MTRTRHVFRQDVPCLSYAALGDTAVRVLAIDHIIKSHALDVFYVTDARGQKLDAAGMQAVEQALVAALGNEPNDNPMKEAV